MTTHDQADALRTWRRGLRLTQLELARLLGCSRWSVVEYESGRVQIPRGVQALLREINESYRQKSDVARRGLKRA